MKSVVLEVAGLGKRYVTYRSNLHRFANWFGAGIEPASEYWAVRDISFALAAGEALAIVGQNGAGKSTLLKLITGTTQPTQGRIGFSGRLSAILELGLGFNPEFTGRENVYQAGGLLGHAPGLLDRLMPAIEDFTEIGDYFDQPLRTYSSGMQARLAFALATAVRPDVLIVDEVLSVGDSYFQHKSFNRIREFKAGGTAILLVTHATGDVRALCERVILLDKGRVVKDGQPDEVVDYYNAMIAERENARAMVEQHRAADGWLRTRSGTLQAVTTMAELVDRASGALVGTARTGQALAVKATVEPRAPVGQLVVGIMIRDRTGHEIWGSNTWHTRQGIGDLVPGDRIDVSLDFDCDLGPGSYSISMALTSSETHLENNFEWVDNLIVFDVVNVDRPVFLGVAALKTAFHLDEHRGTEARERIAMTTSCRDSDVIPKCADAGLVKTVDGQAVQIMHNGLQVVHGGYYGAWMASVIAGLRGHHEPQEELLFHHVLRHVRPDTLIVELGAFWAYYSLWYLTAVPGSEAICIEPDPDNAAIGRRNAALNGCTQRARFVEAWIGGRDEPQVTRTCELSGVARTLPQISMRGIAELAGERSIELLHCDAQGAEDDLLASFRPAVEAGRLRFVMVSTHHHSISGSRTTHRDCLARIEAFGGRILVEHSVEQSFSGDGLILASFHAADAHLGFPEISRNVAERSLMAGQ